MKEINYKEMRFNPFNLIGGEWMLVTAGDENSCNTMTASWGHLGCLWGHNDPTAVIYLRPSRYTKEFVDEEGYFSLCVMDKSFKKQMAYLGSVSGRNEDKIGSACRWGNWYFRNFRRIRIFPWQTSTDPHDCISKGKTSHPYILQTL